MRALHSRKAAPQLADTGCEHERLTLQALGESIEAYFPDMHLPLRGWLAAVRELSDSVCQTFSPEAALASLSWELRRRWLRFAHENADAQIKSPLRDTATAMPSGTPITYGYERCIQPTMLERRCAEFVRTPPGWSAEHVLFSSAQGALAAILHWANAAGYWDAASPRLVFAGSYFETQQVLNIFGGRDLVWSREKSIGAGRGETSHTRTILIEPVFYDEAVNVFDLAAFRRAWPALFADARSLVILDTTLTGPLFSVSQLLESLPGDHAPVVIDFRSGLKLDQAGLELANVGIASVYTHCATRLTVQADVADALRQLRTVLGSSLTLDEISTLEVPWFLDPYHQRRHTNAVFANNAFLAHEVSKRNRLFAQVLHPRFAKPSCPWAEAPYCVFRLPHGEPADYRLLERILDKEAVRRGIHFDLGGSFGFRGHRFEAVVPDDGLGDPFLRVAMGARSGPSMHRVVDLMNQVASVSDVGELIERYGGESYPETD